MADQTIKVGILGWGNAARYFHVPILKSLSNYQLVSLVTTRRSEAEGALPDVKIHETVDGVLGDAEIELVVIATPHLLHFEHARAAIERGKHVVVEKPIAVHPDEVLQLDECARSKGKLLTAFQNRRWDGDLQTIRELLASRRLGEVYHFHSSFPLYRPNLRGVWREDPAAMGGMLYDLGPHLVDQAIVLFGKPVSVYARTAARRSGARTDDYFIIHLVYSSGLEVCVTVDLSNPFSGPRFQVRGSRGAFEKFGLDPQEAALRSGKMPSGDNWGMDSEGNWGALRTRLPSGETTEEKIRTVPGDYRKFYAAVFSTIRSGTEFPIHSRDLILQLQILEAAKVSARDNHVQMLGGTF
jgi:scyllo-inositol 2-dehydrogenase (NADP+)